VHAGRDGKLERLEHRVEVPRSVVAQAVDEQRRRADHAVASAGRAILDIYDSDFAVERKEDNSPLTAADLAWISSVFGAGKPESAAELLDGGDAYYFSHHDSELTLPVYRIVSRGADHTRYYLDPVSGLLLARFGASARGYRWLHQGVHRLDFVRERPLWDVLMLVLLGGVTFVCGTGAYQGIRRLLLHPVGDGSTRDSTP
jgi:hypothetical protein